MAVSSVLPEGAVATEDRTIPRGMVTFCVLAQCRGSGGETVSAGIAYAYRRDGKGGYVAESHMHGGKESVRKDLAAKMKEMSRIRGVEFGDVTFVVSSVDIPDGEYGCALASLVFTERPCTPSCSAGNAGDRGWPTSPRRPPHVRTALPRTCTTRSGYCAAAGIRNTRGRTSAG